MDMDLFWDGWLEDISALVADLPEGVSVRIVQGVTGIEACRDYAFLMHGPVTSLVTAKAAPDACGRTCRCDWEVFSQLHSEEDEIELARWYLNAAKQICNFASSFEPFRHTGDGAGRTPCGCRRERQAADRN